MPATSKARQRAHRAPRANGYVLITVMWFLILGGSIVAVMMLTALREAEGTRFAIDDARRRLAQQSAIETAIADILFEGRQSVFAQLPAQRVYTIDGIDVTVSARSEAGKIDFNQADPQLIERALRGLGVGGQPRERFLADIAARREADRPFVALDDALAAARAAGVAMPDGAPLATHFTTYSGRSRPDPQHLAADLARALNEPAATGPGRVTLGDAVVLTAGTGDARPSSAVVRVTGRLDEAYQILAWGGAP